MFGFFGKFSVLTQNQLYKYPKNSGVFTFSWSRFILQKIQKFLGAPIETSEFHQICANFDRIWHKHAGLRPACEHRANTCETCEHPCEQKTLKKQVVRKSCENVRKSVRTSSLEKTGRANIARTVRTFHPNSTFGRNFTKKTPISERKLHGFAQKNI